MATIPQGQFDAPRVSQVVQTGASLPSNPIPNAAAGLGAALDQTSATLGEIARRDFEQTQALNRARAANEQAEYGLQVDAAVSDVADQLRRGADYTKAGELYDTALSNIQMPQAHGLAPAEQEAYNGGLKLQQMQGRLKVDAASKVARRDDGQKQFAVGLDLAGKEAAQPGADIEAINQRMKSMEGFYVQGFGLDQSATSKAISDRIDANWTDQASARFNSQHDNIEGLRQLQTDLTSGEGYYAGKLDANKRNAMALKVDSRIDVLQGKMDRAQDKADVAAQRVLTQIDAQVSTGIPATMDQWAAWGGAFKDATPLMQQEFNDRIDDEREVQGILRLPIEQQVAAVQQKQAQLATEGGSVRVQNNLKRLSSAVDANVKMLKDEPLQYLATREAEQVEPLRLDALLDPNRQGELAAQIERRSGLVAELRATKGDAVQNRLLLPGEAQALSSLIDKQTPAGKVTLFGQMRQISGSDANYRAVMQQIAPDNPVLALAGSIYVEQRPAQLQASGLIRSAKTATAGDVARMIVTGDAMINKSKSAKAEDGKPSAYPMPPPKEFGTEFSSAVGDAFAGRPGAYDTGYQAVRSYYAAKSAQDGDLSGDLDIGRLREAVHAVLGEPVDVGGSDVLPPWGMLEDEFRDKLDQAWGAVAPDLADGYSHDLDSYSLRQRAGNSYYLVGTNGAFVMGKGGNPVVIDLTKLPTQPPIKPKVAPQGDVGDATGWRGGGGGL